MNKSNRSIENDDPSVVRSQFLKNNENAKATKDLKAMLNISTNKQR